MLAVWYTCLWCMQRLTRAFCPGPGILTSDTAVSSSRSMVSSPQAKSLHPCGASGLIIPSTSIPTRTPSQVLSSASISDLESGCSTRVLPSALVRFRVPRFLQKPRQIQVLRNHRPQRTHRSPRHEARSAQHVPIHAMLVANAATHKFHHPTSPSTTTPPDCPQSHVVESKAPQCLLHGGQA